MNKRPALLSVIGFTFVLLALLSMSFTAQATPSAKAPAQPQALLLAEDFDYGATPGNLTAVSSGNWVAHSGTGVGPVGYATSSLSMSGYGSSGVGGAATVATGNTEDVNRSFITQTTGTLYFAALVNVSAAGTGDYFLHFKDSGNNFRARVYAKNDVGVLRFGLSVTGTIISYSPAAFITNTTYLVVAKYDVDTGDSTLYVLDTFSASEPVTSAVALTSTIWPTTTLQAIAIRQGSPATARPAATIDGIRVATTWAEVMGVAPASEADLSIAKSGPATASAGDPINYTINLTNTGNVTATSTMVTDTLPAGVSFITYTSVSAVGFSQPNPQTLVWNLGDVAAASHPQITVQGTISTGLSTGTSFKNMVTASTTATETTTANNTASVTTTIGAPDLIVLKYGPASVNAGDPVVYTLTYSNVGDLPATGVRLVDQLPAAISYVADSLGGGVRTGNTITWTLGSLPIDASGSIVLTATALTSGDHANVARISSDSTDSNPLNNLSVFTTTILGGDPFVAKTGPAVVFGGQVATYTITYGNLGNAPAAVTITDTLPVSFTTSDIAADTSGLIPLDGINTRAWTTTVGANTAFSFTLAVTVPLVITPTTRITNTIDIATDAAGNVPANDHATASSTVYQIVPIATARAGALNATFGIEGSVIYVPGTLGTNEWGMQDTSGGISIFFSPPPTPTLLGDRMRLVATRSAFSGQAQLGAPVYYFANLGSGPQVTPKPYTTGQVASGASEGWLVVITGTVSNLTACSTTANYQFNLDDGSGSAVIFVDKDTAVNVCALGVVNGDPLVVTGFSTQFTGVFEVKPRFPADVKRVYQVTFTYNDLEDVVGVGEDVQLRGDFTGWATNPITLTHDAGYTVFSTTLILPTDVAQNYKYFVPAGGGGGYDWLNTNDRSIAPQDGVTVQNDYRNVTVGWGNLNGPAAQTISLGQPTSVISGQLYIQGVTPGAGAGRGLKAEVGYGTAAAPTSWSWSGLSYLSENGNNDVYSGVFTPAASGVYSYATRYNGNWGVGNPNSAWVYADLDGIPFSLNQAGVLTVIAPQLSITKTAATAHPIVNLGEVVTYTFTLSNSGNAAATGVLVTDVLPGEVTFGGFIAANGATINGSTIGWSGTLSASTQAQVVFTATLGLNTNYLGRVVTNTVSLTANNAPGQSASATFKVVNPPDFGASTKTSTPSGAVKPGALITYTIVLSNNGQIAATVFLTDVLNAYYTVSNVGDFTQGPAGTLKWNGAVAAGGSVTLVFVAQVKSLGNLPFGVTPLTNSATLNDGLQTFYTLADAAPPSVKVYGLYLPLMTR